MNILSIKKYKLIYKKLDFFFKCPYIIYGSDNDVISQVLDALCKGSSWLFM